MPHNYQGIPGNSPFPSSGIPLLPLSQGGNDTSFLSPAIRFSLPHNNSTRLFSIFGHRYSGILSADTYFAKRSSSVNKM